MDRGTDTTEQFADPSPSVIVSSWPIVVVVFGEPEEWDAGAL